MAVSKVVLGNETLIDLTGDSVSSENLLQGETAHGANGEEVIGGVVVTPMYTGTKAAIEEAIALGQIPEDAVVNITDDEETSSFQTQINEINSSLANGEISFSVVDGEPYVKVGADSPRPFKSDINGTVLIGGVMTINNPTIEFDVTNNTLATINVLSVSNNNQAFAVYLDGTSAKTWNAGETGEKQIDVSNAKSMILIGTGNSLLNNTIRKVQFGIK